MKTSREIMESPEYSKALEAAIKRDTHDRVIRKRFEGVKDLLWDSLKNEEKLKTLPPVVRHTLGKAENLGESATLSMIIDHFAYYLSEGIKLIEEEER